MPRIDPIMSQRCRSIYDAAIVPALTLLPGRMTSPQAVVMLLAIGLQESRLEFRRQIVARGQATGPAAGLWQFELGSHVRGGGVWGVIKHAASRVWLHDLCVARGVAFSAVPIWQAIQADDVLAAGLARLLLFTDARALPEVDDASAAWEIYARRTWCPGKPHRHTWDDFHATALTFVRALGA